jgi:hypothetical protein
MDRHVNQIPRLWIELVLNQRDRRSVGQGNNVEASVAIESGLDSSCSIARQQR